MVESVTDNPNIPSDNVNWRYPKSQCRKAIVIGLEYDSWVRSIRSSLKELMAPTWRRNAVYVPSKGKMKGRRNLK